MANYNFYAIREGTESGIVESWDECASRTQGIGGAEFKGFDSRKRAEAWLNGCDCPTEDEQGNEPSSEAYTLPPAEEGMVQLHFRHGEDETAWFAVDSSGEIVASGLDDDLTHDTRAGVEFIRAVKMRMLGYRARVERREHGEITDEIRKKIDPNSSGSNLLSEDQIEQIRAARQFYQEEKDTKRVCQDVAPVVADMIGGETVAGKWPGGEYGFRHQWVVLDDGTIVDPTADQFDDGHYDRPEEGTRVVPPSHDYYDSYVVHDNGKFVPMSEFLEEDEEFREETEGHCSRCCNADGPDGWIEAFDHVQGGICFRCWGSGDEQNPAEPPKQSQMAMTF